MIDWKKKIVDVNERLKELAQQLVDNPTDANVIVGHSSGSAIADELAEIAGELRDKPNFRLIVLDGFGLPLSLFRKVDVACWSARNQDHMSLNWHEMKATGAFREMLIPWSGPGLWALHFYLVNSNATPETVDRIVDGYRDCKTNLQWLEAV